MVRCDSVRAGWSKERGWRLAGEGGGGGWALVLVVKEERLGEMGGLGRRVKVMGFAGVGPNFF